MKVLGIETSCDDTSAAVVEDGAPEDRVRLLRVRAAGRDTRTAVVAAHPLPNAMPCFAPSRAARHCSSAVRVGLPARE